MPEVGACQGKRASKGSALPMRKSAQSWFLIPRFRFQAFVGWHSDRRVAHPFCFSFPFQDCGCAVLALSARAGTMLPAPCGFWIGERRTVAAGLVVPALHKVREGLIG